MSPLGDPKRILLSKYLNDNAQFMRGQADLLVKQAGSFTAVALSLEAMARVALENEKAQEMREKN